MILYMVYNPFNGTMVAVDHGDLAKEKLFEVAKRHATRYQQPYLLLCVDHDKKQIIQNIIITGVDVECI